MSDGLTRALRFLRELQKLDPRLTISCLCTFLVAAEDEGGTIGRIIRLTPSSRSTVSRHVQELSEVSAFKMIGGKVVPVPGLGLVLIRDRPEDRREKEVYLTVRGRALVAIIEGILEQP
jgi:DNA-binding MarR family transcriptional regulator